MTNIYFFKSSLLCLFIFICNIVTGQQIIDNKVKQFLIDQNKVECLITFHSDVVIPILSGISKNEKGSIVFSILKKNTEKAQKEVIEYLTKNDIPYKSFSIVNMIYANINREQANSLSQMSNVSGIQHNPQVHLQKPIQIQNSKEEDILVQRSAGEPEWNIKAINADKVWDLGYEGEGVVIAGADTGIDFENPLLIEKYRGPNANNQHGYHWHDAIHELSPLHEDPIISPENNPCGFGLMAPCDDHGHGTHTMGTMVGSDGDNLIGVAPKATWIGCRNMERGYGSPASYVECFEWFLAPTNRLGEHPDPKLAPHVINNSWSCPEMEGCNSSNWNVIETAVNNLRAAGIVVVVSAGNSGPDCSTVSVPPSMFPNSFAVGATDINDDLAGFSSKGPVVSDGSGRLKPDVTAPGVNIRSAIIDNQFAAWSGTSMAGPHVAATVALLIDANPNLGGEVDVIEDILRSTAKFLIDTLDCGSISGSQVPNNSFGYGRIDALAAVQKALQTVSTTSNNNDISINLFPNPTTNKIQIRSNQALNGTLELVNLEGKSCLTKPLNNLSLIELDLSHLEAGSYLYYIQTAKAYKVGKIIKAE